MAQFVKKAGCHTVNVGEFMSELGDKYISTDGKVVLNYATAVKLAQFVYDKSKGDALSLIKDSSEYYDAKGEINHSSFEYSKVEYDKTYMTSISSVEEREINCTEDGKNCLTEIVEIKTKVPVTVREEGVSLDKEVALLKQAIYELKKIVEQQQIEIDLLKSTEPTEITK